MTERLRRNTASWLIHTALGLLSAFMPCVVSAQEKALPNLETLLSPGMTVWMTDSAGREEKTRIVDVTRDSVTTTDGANSRSLLREDIRRVKVRHSDSVLNGALIGAGAAVAAGLLLCNTTEPWENCRDDIGPMVRIGALGAGIGIAIDALIRGRKTIYDAASTSSRLHATPILTPHARGLRVSLRF